MAMPPSRGVYNIQESENEQILRNRTRGATETHQKEHLGLFLPARTENRPLANLQTRRGLCCQSTNPQIILEQNGCSEKLGHLANFTVASDGSEAGNRRWSSGLTARERENIKEQQSKIKGRRD